MTLHLTFASTANAAEYCGATPVFVDTDPETWALGPDHLKTVVTSEFVIKTGPPKLAGITN